MMKEKFSFEPQYRARTIFNICNTTFMVLLMVVMLVPLIKVLSDSLDRSTTYGLTFFPKNFSLVAYYTIFTKEAFFRPFLISVLTTTTGTLLGLTLTTLGAYVLSKRDLVGRDFLAMFVFITMIFRGGIVPTFLVIKQLHLLNTLFAVVLPTAVNVVYMVLMRNFFEQIPKSLLESAEMDGASPMKTFLRIVLPLSKAGLAAIGLFYIVQYWNQFFAYVIYITDTRLFNFQLKLRELVLLQQTLNDPAVVGYGDMVNNAAVIVAILPFLFIYPFAQKYFITGVTLGAVKE